MADTPEDIKNAQKKYLLIGLILFIFTVVTVAVATVPWLDFGEHGFELSDSLHFGDGCGSFLFSSSRRSSQDQARRPDCEAE